MTESGRRGLPSGTVTFLFTDIEGSTRLLHSLGADAYAGALASHRRILRQAFDAHGGVEVDTQGDAFFVAFPTAPAALAAATDATNALASGPIKVRIGLHTGTPLLTDEGYVGPDVHRAARIAAAGHGGQILVSSTTAQLVDATGLRDLGDHRLKDLAAAERIYQADPNDHPPLKSLHQTNLPVPATPFLGRDADVADLRALLVREDVRLVTLTGAGGTGKTRLALQAAAESAEAFPDGVWWVPLAALRDPGLVLESAGRALGAAGDLAEHLGDKRLLLLLDNFEHLVPAAEQLAPLLAACPHVTLLVTSREPLHLGAEHEVAVDPLAPATAVELFLTRAVAAKRDFVANGEVAQICARLDHLPLAIELAAARVKILSAAALLARLEQRLPLLAGGARDLPERQRTLRATIEWSHELLTPDEQVLFARLAVFHGGWTLEAAEAVAEADLDTLQSLVDRSLVRVRDTGRFWMLETIREFAIERLAGTGEADARRDRHGEFFLSLCEEAEPHVLHDDLEWLNRLEADHDNIRAALDGFVSARDAARAQRMAATLWRFWYLKTHFTEGMRRSEEVLALSDASTSDRATILRGSSVMAMNVGDTTASIAFARAARTLDEALGNEWGVAYSTMMIGNSLGEARDESRDLIASREHLAEAAAMFERLGDRQFALIATHNQGWIYGDLGDRVREDQIHTRSLEIAREIGHAGIEADALAQLAMSASDAGRLDDAIAMLHGTLRIDHASGMLSELAINLGRLSSVEVRRGDTRRAVVLLAASEQLTEQVGAKPTWWTRRRNDETVDLARAAGLDGDELEAAMAEGRALTSDEAVATALGESG